MGCDEEVCGMQCIKNLLAWCTEQACVGVHLALFVAVGVGLS